jgi:hypothetical protein
MVSVVEICNQALGNIEATALVNSLDTPYESEEARYCDLYFERTRNAVMRDHPWNFLATTVALGNLGSPPTGWSFRYQYPTNCIRAVEIVRTNRTDPKIDFEVRHDGSAGRVILTDLQDAELKFTQLITDPNVYDDMFLDALSWALAFRLAGPVTGNDTKKQQALTVYQNLIDAAEAEDSAEGIEDTEVDASWIEARL